MKLLKRIAAPFFIQLRGLEIFLLDLKAHLVKGYQQKRPFFIRMYMLA
ncbi:hypothetical protein [Bacillus licheniformis]|nr:hypothetical protein [Bacillus licheniformis]